MPGFLMFFDALHDYSLSQTSTITLVLVRVQSPDYIFPLLGLSANMEPMDKAILNFMLDMLTTRTPTLDETW